MKLLRSFDPERESLNGILLFEGAEAGSLAAMLRAAKVWSVEAGEQVLAASAQNGNLYIVLQGGLRVELGPGERRAAMHVGRGECVGELSVIDGALTSAAVTAEAPGELLALDRPQVLELADHSHAVARNLLRLLSGRLRGTNQLLMEEAHKADTLRLNSITDALTGLYSRDWLDGTLERLSQRAGQGGTGFALLLLDVDHFQNLNEIHGRAVGDRALALVAHALRSGLRPTDQAARYGGDEFVILLPGAASIAIAAAIAERACAAVRLARDRDDEALRLTCSGGAAVHVRGDTPKLLLDRANAALESAKSAGGNRVTGA